MQASPQSVMRVVQHAEHNDCGQRLIPDPFLHLHLSGSGSGTCTSDKHADAAC